MAPAPVEQIKPDPVPNPPNPPKPSDPYSNFDILDDITFKVKETPTPPVNPAPKDSTPKPTISEVIKPQPVQNDQTDFNLDFLGGQSEKKQPTGPEVVSTLTPMDFSVTEPKTPKEPEFLPDDTIWLNERELDNSGRDGLKVYGKWFLKLKSKLFLRITIWNKNPNAYRSPRLDIKDNYYNILFLKEGVGFPLKSLEGGEFIILEKGKFKTNFRNVQEKGRK